MTRCTFAWEWNNIRKWRKVWKQQNDFGKDGKSEKLRKTGMFREFSALEMCRIPEMFQQNSGNFLGTLPEMISQYSERRRRHLPPFWFPWHLWKQNCWRIRKKTNQPNARIVFKLQNTLTSWWLLNAFCASPELPFFFVNRIWSISCHSPKQLNLGDEFPTLEFAFQKICTQIKLTTKMHSRLHLLKQDVQQFCSHSESEQFSQKEFLFDNLKTFM